MQTTGFNPVQTPPRHVSACVQALPSLQALPSATGGSEQKPDDGSHTPAAWHWSLAPQTTWAPGWQAPPPHVSPTVQAFPSVQALVLLVKTHPAAGVHVSVVHGLWSLQSSVPVPGWHVPPPQMSPTVHVLPSEHAFVLFVKTQPLAGLQVSVVQTLLSLQVLAVPRHTPQEHVSLIVQALLSVQALPLARFVQLLVSVCFRLSKDV